MPEASAEGLSSTEEEVVFLLAIKEIIDSIVNFEMLELLGSDPGTEISFKTATHQKYFNILLVDLLSTTDRAGIVRKTSYMDALGSIAQSPSFSIDNSIVPLAQATRKFNSWLEQEVLVETWLPSLDTKVALKLTRSRFIRMCGNISKHNFLRTVRVADELKDLLSASGRSVRLEEAILALNDFYERFHGNIITYHGSTLAEFLNNIQWGIYEYLQPELNRSIVWESADSPKYHFKYPDAVKSYFAKECYWELMNQVRHRPCVRRFRVTELLKTRY